MQDDRMGAGGAEAPKSGLGVAQGAGLQVDVSDEVTEQFGLWAESRADGFADQASFDERSVQGRAPQCEVRGRLLDMLDKERRYGKLEDYIAKVQRHGMRPVWRSRLFEWLFEFVDEFDLGVATVATAINFVDRYLSQVSTKKSIMQLLALTAILVASKLHEPRPLGMAELRSLADGVYLESDIRLMELELLRVLDWKVAPITPYCFLRYLIAYFDDVDAKTRERVLAFAETFLEIVLCEYPFVHFSPSECATASLLCALDSCKLALDGPASSICRAGLLDGSRVADCKALLLCYARDVFPELFRSEDVVSPDCVADTCLFEDDSASPRGAKGPLDGPFSSAWAE